MLGGLRIAALAVLMVCLFRPILLISAAVPQRTTTSVCSSTIRAACGLRTRTESRAAIGSNTRSAAQIVRSSSPCGEVPRADVPLLVDDAAYRQRRRPDVQRARHTPRHRDRAGETRARRRSAVRLVVLSDRADNCAGRSATSSFRSAPSPSRSSPLGSAPRSSARTSRSGASTHRTRCSRAARSSPI